MSKQDINCCSLYIASNWAALGICYNSGQDCTAGSRVYVQETIYDKFLDLLVQKVKAQTIGDGFDEQSGGGPVVSIVFYSIDMEFLFSSRL
jgi:aldehyde dehydrogenase (NAD+)